MFKILHLFTPVYFQRAYLCNFSVLTALSWKRLYHSPQICRWLCVDVAPLAGAGTLLQQNTTSISPEEYITFYIQKHKKWITECKYFENDKWHLNPYVYIIYDLFFLQKLICCTLSPEYSPDSIIYLSSRMMFTCEILHKTSCYNKTFYMSL